MHILPPEIKLGRKSPSLQPLCFSSRHSLVCQSTQCPWVIHMKGHEDIWLPRTAHTAVGSHLSSHFSLPVLHFSSHTLLNTHWASTDRASLQPGKQSTRSKVLRFPDTFSRCFLLTSVLRGGKWDPWGLTSSYLSLQTPLDEERTDFHSFLCGRGFANWILSALWNSYQRKIKGCKEEVLRYFRDHAQAKDMKNQKTFHLN